MHDTDRITKDEDRPCCPYNDCPTYGREGDISIHRRNGDKTGYLCRVCGRTFSIPAEEENPLPIFNLAKHLYKSGSSVDKIAFQLGIKRRTVYRWLKKGKE